MTIFHIGQHEQVDLHLHSSASDGTWSPRELVKRVAQVGIKAMSLTDHDTTANVAETATLARGQGLLFIPGVEVNSRLADCCFHILGYYPDIHNSSLQSLLRYNVDLLRNSDRYAVETSAKCGEAVSVEEYDKYTHDPSRGGWKGLSYLVDTGVCKDANDFFRKFPNSLDLEFYPPPDVIDVIKGAGGRAVLAHPGSRFRKRNQYEALDEVLRFFGDIGIDGVECFHISHSAPITEFCLDWCKKKNLLVTGGSDSHGDFVEGRTVGVPRVTARQVDIIGLR